MGAKTKIEWADATWNPVTGCLHGCPYCYARSIAQRFGCKITGDIRESTSLVELDEPYISEKAFGECNINLPYQVPEDCCFVLGDHRATSIDSRNRSVGCIPDSKVVGRLLLRIWPIEDFGRVE